MIKLKDGRIQIHYDRDKNRMTIDLVDRKSTHVPFAQVTLTFDNFCQALSSMALVECVDITLENLERVGKKLITEGMCFKMPKDTPYNKEVAKKIAEALCPKGWKSDTTFSSRDSFFEKGGTNFARTIIRKWVEEED